MIHDNLHLCSVQKYTECNLELIHHDTSVVYNHWTTGLDWTGLDHDVIWRPEFQKYHFIFFIFLFLHVCVCVCVCVHMCVLCTCMCVYVCVCACVCVYVYTV